MPALPNLPTLPPYVASATTGLVIGILTVALTVASFGVCELATGTSSCGGPGFFLLTAILIAMVLLGGLLLRLFGVPDPGSTSFLAVGLTAVIALLFLIEVILAWPMLIVIPIVSVLMYLLSHWVTATFVEPAKD